MKPYAFDPRGGNDVGCCPGHDWPVCYRWAGKYTRNAPARRAYKKAVRSRRRRDRFELRNERCTRPVSR